MQNNNPIISAANDTTKDVFMSDWGGEFSISAASPEVPQAPDGGKPAGTDGGSHARLDNDDAKGGKMDPGPRGHKIDGKDEKAPLPTFKLQAYNGGAMRLSGWDRPVVVDVAGAAGAGGGDVPIYVGHPSPIAAASELMETLVGQSPCMSAAGLITAGGNITGTSKTVALMREHAANGFKFQCSIHGQPTLIEEVAAGTSVMVNGRSIMGPARIARKSVIDHIAILPLGADTTTSARIAAQHAAGADDMDFVAWLKANHGGMDQAGFNALPETVKTTIKASFDTASKPPEKKPENPGNPSIAASGAMTDAAIEAQNNAVSANLNRISGIQAIEGAAGFPKIVAQAVNDKWTVEKAENAIIKAQRDALTQQSFGANVNTNNSANAKVRNPRVLEAATLLSCGYSAAAIEKDRQYGAEVLNLTDDFARMERSRIITPSKLARIIARNAGVSLPDGHGDDFWSEALAETRICPRGGERIIAGYGPMSAEFSNISLPVALSNVMNKFVLMGYNSVDPNACEPSQNTQAWKSICRVSSVQDFKPHYRNRMVATVMLKSLLKGGEIQHGSVGEQSYMLTADTKAIMLGLTRKDLINDDQSVLSTLPTHFGVGAGRTVANDIWDCWLAALQSNGSTAFWTAADITTEGSKMKINLTAGAALAFATLEAAHLRQAAQIDPTGQPAGILGQVLLVPTALAGTAMQLNTSERAPVYATTRAAAVGDANTMRGRQKCVASAYLQNGTIKSDGTVRAGSATDWFLSAFASDTAYPIEIGFLNGIETPIIERAEADFNRLGISFRTFLDYGVAMGEPRSAQKQTA